MLLAIETATAGCSVALIAGDRVVAAMDETVGRGHAERLVPQIAELLAAVGITRAEAILVDCGPGSFTGVRVGLAAARGLALGWGVPVAGCSSLALIAAAALAEHDADEIAVAIAGGHGELFVQCFAARPTLHATGAPASLTPADAAAAVPERLVAGSGAELLVAARGAGAACAMLPRATHATLLPPALATLPPTPIYGRAPDAKPRATGAIVREGAGGDLDELMTTMADAFDSRFGEAWTRTQCAGVLGLPGVRLLLARSGAEPAGFALIRTIQDEAELLLLGVRPRFRRTGIGRGLLDAARAAARAAGGERMFLEMREGNPAIALYRSAGFAEIGRRVRYYRGADGKPIDALTLSCRLDR